jgi:hypothetical protein
MKTIFGKFLIAATALTFAFGNAHGATSEKTSKLYAYKGNYSGTLIISGSGTSAIGSTTGKFSANKKKDVGTLNLTSFVSVSGSSIAVIENYTFNKRSFNYFLSAGTSGPGSGVVSIGKKVISYTGSVNVSGTVYTVTGTARLNNKSLSILEVLTSQSTTLTFSYNLKRKGK